MAYSLTPRGSVLEAADAAASDYFGSSAALSSDGLVLVVGAKDWEGTYAGQGGVYVYDWSGGAWVQRGSVLTDPVALYGNERFGAGVALSSNGLVLAVGATGQDAAGSEYTYAGVVYVFDWSGSAWVQRGSALTSVTAQSVFGSAIALSADGSVMAVGQPEYWTSGPGQIGRVHLFDWSGSAWSERTPFNAADAGDVDLFGAAAALSGDGLVLAVGATGWDGAYSGQGGVYTYDWSGGVWVARGSVLVAADASLSAMFGSALSLSTDGTLLSVGAKNRTGPAGGGQGAVYLYESSGSSWTQSGSVILAADAAADNFGSAVALARDKSVLAIGAVAWEGAATDQGGVYLYDVAGVVVGASSAPTELTLIASTGASSAPTALTIASATGVSSAATALTVSATGASSAPTALALVSPTQEALWSARCMIDGVDVSRRLKGQISVTADEGAARITSLTMLPASGAIDPLDYVGKTISLDYVRMIGGVAVPQRLFTGRIDTPRYDLATTLLQLDCVDDLQNRVASLDRSVIDALVGGKYSTAVHGEVDDNWDYAEARLSSVAASLDAGPSGGLRLTPWEIAASWTTYDDSSLLYPRARLSLPQRSTLVNSVDIAFDYRYPRLRQRETTLGWSGTNIDMLPNGYQYPTQQDILGAAGGSGWTVTLGVFYPAPDSIPHSSGGFIYPAADAIDMAILHLAQRHAQTVTEKFTMLVTADESVALNGTLPHALRGALESEFDGGAWESALDVAPLLPGGGELDYAPDAPRADADYAIETLLNQALTKILSTHRGARVGNAVRCNPDLDVDKKVTISTTELSASGKVASVVHLLDLDSGSATSEFELAIFGAGGAGIITPTTLAAPTPPAEAAATQDWPSNVPPLFVNTYGVTAYTDSLMGLLLNPPETIAVDNVPGVGSTSFANPYYVSGAGYPVTGFRCRMPGVDDADRNPLEKLSSANYSLIVPTDTLSFTVP